MTSQLTLDRSDPGVDELVAGWANGQSYRVTLDITQTASDPKMATFDVTSVESEEEPEEENETMKEDSEGKEATYGMGGPGGKMHKGPAIVIAFKK